MVRVWVLDPRSPEQAGSMVEEVATLTHLVQEFVQWVVQTGME